MAVIASWGKRFALLLAAQDGDTLKGSAMKAEELINQALAIDPANPLALHLHIHIAEAASPQRCGPPPPAHH